MKGVVKTMHGDGTISHITQTKNGKAYKYIMYRFFDNTGKRHSKLFPDTKEGKMNQKEFEKEIRQKKDNSMLHSCGYTVGDWVKEYLSTYVKNTVRDTTFTRMLQSACKLEPIKDIELDKLSPAKIQELYNNLSDKLSASSIVKVHRLLAAAYKKAYVTREINYNPVLAVTPPKAERKKEKEIFTNIEILQIFKAIKHIKNHPGFRSTTHDYHTMVLLLLTTGMRIGELLALQWQDIDFGKRLIHIHSTISHTEIHQPKTATGDRLIPILFDSMLKRLQALRKANGTYKISGYIFATKTGRPMSYQNFLKRWQTICKMAAEDCKKCGNKRSVNWQCSCGNIVKKRANTCSVCGQKQPKQWLCQCGTTNKEIEKTIHTFRHTFATIMLSKGIPIKEVSIILGHAQASTTTDMYTHAISNYNEKLIKEFSRSERKKAAK